MDENILVYVDQVNSNLVGGDLVVALSRLTQFVADLLHLPASSLGACDDCGSKSDGDFASMPFTIPTATTTCTHTFCKDCITKALAFHEECPVDRSVLTLADLQPASTIVRNVSLPSSAFSDRFDAFGYQLVDELIVQCPNAPFGCQQTCQRQLLGSHLSHECLHVSTHCCEEDCDATPLRRDIDKHARDCIHRIVSCHACEARVKFKDTEVRHRS